MTILPLYPFLMHCIQKKNFKQEYNGGHINETSYRNGCYI